MENIKKNIWFVINLESNELNFQFKSASIKLNYQTISAFTLKLSKAKNDIF